jgi:hypothetical protein
MAEPSPNAYLMPALSIQPYRIDPRLPSADLALITGFLGNTFF